MDSEAVGLGIAFALGFVGSVHCMGMCGGFALLSGVGGGTKATRAVRISAYLVGKTVTYIVLGAVLAGLVTTIPPSASFVQKGIALATGIFLVFAGLHMTGRGPAWLFMVPKSSSALVARMSAAVKRSSVTGRFVLGLINGLLPCGLLYGALGYAALMKTWMGGAAFMGLFGLGTAPALAFVALGATFMSASRRAGLYHGLGWLVAMMGVLTVVRVTQLMPLIMSAI